MQCDPVAKEPANTYTETLLPNEIRIKSTGNFGGQVHFILETLGKGYSHCKVVGRGNAVERVIELIKVVKENAPQFLYEASEIKSLNMNGDPCSEIHIMISATECET